MNNQVEADGAAAVAAEQVYAGPATLRDFITLAKPGILFSNSITTFAGFWLASQWDVDWLKMIWTLLGTVLVMASGCVLNNYLDRDMDVKMERTKKRALPLGKLHPSTVLSYGIVLGVAGLAVLGLLLNTLTALLGLLGLFVYVWVYTAWLKRTSVWSTMVGGVSGAVPPMIGYCAVTEQIDVAAILLFAIMFLWQPPHFWALAIRRVEDYRAAGYPLLPVVRGSLTTKLAMLRYVVLVVPVSILLYVLNYTGYIYLTVATLMGLYWVWIVVKGFRVRAQDETEWAKRAFIYSINYLTILFIVMVIDTVGR